MGWKPGCGSVWRFDEATDVLRDLWSRGLSASQIATALCRFGPVSRNSVIGKAHRMGLDGRPSPIRWGANNPRRKRGRKQPMTTLAAYLNSPPAVEALPPAVAPARTAPVWQSAEAAPLPVSSTGDPGEREGDGRPCQWIAGEPSADDACKCRAPVVPDKPYCRAHSRAAYLRRDKSGNLVPWSDAAPAPARLERLAAAE